MEHLKKNKKKKALKTKMSHPMCGSHSSYSFPQCMTNPKALQVHKALQSTLDEKKKQQLPLFLKWFTRPDSRV